MSAVRFAQCQHLTDDKLSALLGLTRAVHHKAVQESQALEKSFEQMNTLLLRHSVHRPPWSAAVFSFADMKAISTWFTQTYFTHYKLYQYAFTPRVLLNIKTHTAATLIETAPALPPLASAITEEVHSSQVDAARAIQEAKAEAEATMVRTLLTIIFLWSRTIGMKPQFAWFRRCHGHTAWQARAEGRWASHHPWGIPSHFILGVLASNSKAA